MSAEEIFLEFSAEKLNQLHGRIQDCLGRLTPEQIWARNSENENAVEFYRALGGKAVARSSEKFGTRVLDKVAYGWQS